MAQLIFKSIFKTLMHRLFHATFLTQLCNKSIKRSFCQTKKQEQTIYNTTANSNKQQQIQTAKSTKSKNVKQEWTITQNLLSKCSPLMREILKEVDKVQGKINIAKPQQIQQEQNEKTAIQTNHDIQNFRHMLAGPIMSQVNLDKFCMKKKCPIFADIKYDGQRTYISFERNYGLEMTSRNSKSQNHSYRKLYDQIHQQLLECENIQSIKLDGEIVALNKNTLDPLPFGELLKYKKLKETDILDLNDDPNKLIVIYIFDVLEYNGKSMLMQELLERRKLIPNISVFKPTDYRIVHFPEERSKIFDFFKEALDKKYEGLILKGTKDLYYTNESRVHWKKLKRGFTNTRDTNLSKIELDLIVMGANRGKNIRNSKTFTSFLLGAEYKDKIVPISSVGSGFSDEIFTTLHEKITKDNLIVDAIPKEYDLGPIRNDVYFRPGLVFEVHAQELTVSPLYKLGSQEYGGLSLRFPSFKRIRDDKGVNEATKGEEIIEMSKSFNFNLPK